MLRHILVLIVTSGLCVPNIARANPYVITSMKTKDVSPEETRLYNPIPELPERVTSLKKGQRAPYTGILLSPGAAAKISVDKETEEARCNAKIERETSIQAAELQLEIDTLEARNDSLSERIEMEKKLANEKQELLSTELEKAQKKAATANKWSALYFAGGVAAGVLVIVAGAYAVRGVRESNL